MSSPLPPRARAFGLLIQAIPALALALEFYWQYTYTGLHRLFVEWHLWWSGDFRETSDGACAFIVALLLGYGIAFGLAACRLFGKLDDSSPIGEAAWLYGMIPTTVGLGFLGWGLYLVYWGWTAGDERRVDLAAVEAGSDPGSRRVSVLGRALADRAISLSSRGIGPRDLYVPLVSSDWRPGRPLAVVLRIDGVLDRELVESGDRFGGPAFEGMISPSGLPGPVRARFESQGLVPGGHFFVLDVGGRPEQVASLGWGSLAIGLVLCSIFALRWLPSTSRARPASPVRTTVSRVDKALPPVVGWSILGGFLLLMALFLLYTRLSGP